MYRLVEIACFLKFEVPSLGQVLLLVVTASRIFDFGCPHPFCWLSNIRVWRFLSSFPFVAKEADARTDW